MNVKTKLLGMAAALATTAAVNAQSFNVDVGTSVATAPGFGAPSPLHGGAANQAGVWNNMTTQASIPLLDLGGLATGVTLARSSTAGNAFAFNNANTSGDFQLLLDDGQDIGGPASPAVTYTFQNLAAGVYDVYSYGVAPDSSTFITSAIVGGGPAQNIGGVMPVNAYAAGITHSLVSGFNHGGGNLAIVMDCVSGFGTVNGFQLVLIPGPGALAVFGLASLMGSRRRRN